jgi:hypothetical protein
MNECDECDRRFKCLTNVAGDVCPTADGSEITNAWTEISNITIIFNDGQGRKGLPSDERYRIQPQEFIKLLRKGKYHTVRRRGLIYLEVIE